MFQERRKHVTNTCAICLTVPALADWLKKAKRAHAAWEKVLGAPDPDWPSWYAQFIGRMVGQPVESDDR